MLKQKFLISSTLAPYNGSGFDFYLMKFFYLSATQPDQNIQK